MLLLACLDGEGGRFLLLARLDDGSGDGGGCSGGIVYVCLAAAESDGKSLITLVTYNYHDGIPSCMLR